MDVRDKQVVVITGATSGIGEACVRAFASIDSRVVFIGRNKDKGQQLEQELCSKGSQVEFIACDVSKEDDVTRLRDIIRRKYERVDVLFNNAGVMLPSCEIERMPIEDWEKTFDINVRGIFLVTRLLKEFIFESKGCIINNASIAGMQSYSVGRSYAYSASKAAVIQFSRQMAKNYAEEGVRVNCICPGIVDTQILGDRDRNEYAKRIPLGRVGSPEDVANTVLFLASPQASYITGVVLPIDGGVTL